MMQFYFLSVLINCIVGLALIFSDTTDERYQFFEFVKNQKFKLISGIASILISLVTLFGTYKGSWIILGDLIPSLSGLTAGFILLFSFYLDRRTIEPSEKESKIEKFFILNRKYFGVTCLVAALLHFFFPKVVIL